MDTADKISLELALDTDKAKDGLRNIMRAVSGYTDSVLAFNRALDAMTEKTNGFSIYNQPAETAKFSAPDNGETQTADGMFSSAEISGGQTQENQKQYDTGGGLLESARQTLQEISDLENEQAQRSNEITRNKYEQNKQTAGKGLEDIFALFAGKNKDMAQAGKIFSIARGTINTFEAATEALKIPIVGPAKAAAITALGLKYVENISGVALAKGGMINPVDGGVNAVIAEAGKAEAVIPLEDERTARKLRKSLGLDETLQSEQTANAVINFSQNINIESGETPAESARRIADEIRAAAREGVGWALDLARVNYKIGKTGEDLTAL